MQLQSRIVNVKRHTVGYKVGSKNRTRKEAVNLADQGKIDGVTTRYGGNDQKHIISLPGYDRVTDLPERVVKDEENFIKTRRVSK